MTHLPAARFSIAPMMDWTDRHCRFLHRQITRQSLLYTEMIPAAALVRGRASHLLDYHPLEHPLAAQLGGSDPAELADAAAIVAAHGYGEVNLNIGCPSDRVQSGAFGAILMKDPDHAAQIVAAMIRAVAIDVTVKCRIGVDDQTPEAVLPDFLARMRDAGVRRIAIHARKAWLTGLSPKDNRAVPPLNYPLVYEMKDRFGDLHLSVNGGIDTFDDVARHLAAGMDGVMIGRAAYQGPFDMLSRADSEIFGSQHEPARMDIVNAMRPYIDDHLHAGGKLAHVTRHMLGLFAGHPGARRWRRVLSEGAHRPGAGLDLIDRALDGLAEAA